MSNVIFATVQLGPVLPLSRLLKIRNGFCAIGAFVPHFVQPKDPLKVLAVWYKNRYKPRIEHSPRCIAIVHLGLPRQGNTRLLLWFHRCRAIMASSRQYWTTSRRKSSSRAYKALATWNAASSEKRVVRHLLISYNEAEGRLKIASYRFIETVLADMSKNGALNEIFARSTEGWTESKKFMDVFSTHTPSAFNFTRPGTSFVGTRINQIADK